jgi:hypothetical protein
MSVGPAGRRAVVLHTTHPATPPAMPERITWSADLVLESSELIRGVQCTYAKGSVVDVGSLEIGFGGCSVRGTGSLRDHVIRPWSFLSSDAMTSKAKSDVKVLKGQDGEHFCLSS